MAALLDNSNFAAANWMGFNSNLTVNFGSTEGWHEVRVGLRGHFADSQSWQSKRIKLDLTPPLLVVTNPASFTGSQPLIQLQGYGSEPLASVVCDLINAAGSFSNLQGLVTLEAYNTNSFEFTTNYFQCYDLWLTNGANTITLHVTDLAGNTTTTNLIFTLDGSGDTKPPIISLLWPQSGMKIGSDAFTVNGFVDDPSATLTAILVNSDGATNTVAGTVGRSGEFWVANLPLGSGTNQLYLKAADFWGNSVTTNIVLLNAGFTLSVNELTPEQLQQLTATVTGTISGTNQDVWVNGIQAVVSHGVWQADNVAINHDKTVAFEAKAVPVGGNPNATASTAEARSIQAVPPRVQVVGYHHNLDRKSVV